MLLRLDLRPMDRTLTDAEANRLRDDVYQAIHQGSTGQWPEVLAFSAFPFDHWRKLWSNNPLERLNKEIKRSTNVVGIFSSDLSALRLIGAVLADQHDEWVIARRYLSEGSMAQLTATRQTCLVQSGELTPAT